MGSRMIAGLRYALALLAAPLTMAASPDPIYKIGVALPLSGPAAPTGQVFRPGYEAAVKYVNTAGLLTGSVQAVFEDNQCAPAPTVTAVQKFVSIEQVTTLTVVCSGPILAAAPAAERNQIPLINVSASSPAMAGVNPYVVSLNPLLNGELPPVLAYAAQTLKIKTIAVVYSAETLGKTANEAVTRMAPALGMKVVGSVSVDPTKTSDFSGQIATLRSLQPGAVYIGMVGGAEAVMTAIRESGMQAQILSFDLFNTPQITGLSAAQGAVYAVQSFDLTSQDKVTQDFLAVFKAANGGKMPNSGQVQAANSIVLSAILFGALQREGKPVTGANVLDLIKRTPRFDLIGGPTSIKYPGAYTVGAIDLIKIDSSGAGRLAVIPAAEVMRLQTQAGL